MKKGFHTTIIKAAAIAAALAALVCCGKQLHQPQMQETAIGFGTATVAGTGAAGAKAGENNFGRDFVVCAVKDASSGKQFVFPGYTVRYENPGYNYIIGSQTVKYWDPQASGYAFWGFSPESKATVIPDDMAAVSVEMLPQEAQSFYFSDVNNVVPSAYGNDVQLSFNRLGSRVRFGFYETLVGMGVKELSFSVSGDFLEKASYSLSAQGISLVSSTLASGVAVPTLPGPIQSGSSQLAEGRDLTAWIPVLPMASTGMSLTIESCIFTQDGTGRTMHLVNPIKVSIPQEYTYLAPNREYSFIFQISSVEEDFDHIIFGFQEAIVRDWADNGAEGTYDFIP